MYVPSYAQMTFAPTDFRRDKLEKYIRDNCVGVGDQFVDDFLHFYELYQNDSFTPILVNGPVSEIFFHYIEIGL